MMRARFAFLAFVLFLTACEGGIPPAQKYATVTGRVVDAATSTPIAGATVTLLVVLQGQSQTDGTYKITNVPSGQLDGTVSAPGYQAYQINGESAVAGQPLTINVSLKKQR